MNRRHRRCRGSHSSVSLIPWGETSDRSRALATLKSGRVFSIIGPESSLTLHELLQLPPEIAIEQKHDQTGKYRIDICTAFYRG